MKTSIIIATYGEERWSDLAHARALPSAQGQGQHEILIGHDPDATIAQVRNALARKAEGDWLCFLDADDELEAGYLSAMQQAREQEEGSVLLTPAVRKMINGRRRSADFYGEVDLLQANWLVVGTLVERELFAKVGGFGDFPHGFEDWSLWFKCVKMGARVVRVPAAIYRQHINPRSKHRQGWRNRQYQVSTHLAVQAELEAWTP